MILINFSHPLTPKQLKETEVIVGQPIEQVFNLPVQFDNQSPYLLQLKKLFTDFPVSSEQLQICPLLVNLPSLNFIAGLVLAELHGRMGYFPPVLRLRPVPESLPPCYEVVEVLNLQAVRDGARIQRYDFDQREN